MSRPIEDGVDDSSTTTDTLPTYRSEDQLRQLVEIVEVARSVPMSSTVMVHREEVLDILDDVLAHLPDELRAARWLLKEREEFRAKAYEHLALDHSGALVYLAPTRVNLQLTLERWPGITFRETREHLAAAA